MPSDPQGRGRLLVPVQVHPCDVVGLLETIVPIDLVGVSEQAARERLLSGVQQDFPHPTSVPYPGLPQLIPERPDFPGALPSLWSVPYQRNPLFTGREELLAQLEHASTGPGRPQRSPDAQGAGPLGRAGGESCEPRVPFGFAG